MESQGASSSAVRPRRTCIGCRRRSQQRSLVRFAVAGGAIVVDADQRLPGRGAYLCWRMECATKVLSDGRRLAHALRTTRDRVTVDTAALLQDWDANRRARRPAENATHEATRAAPAALRPQRRSSVGDGT